MLPFQVQSSREPEYVQFERQHAVYAVQPAHRHAKELSHPQRHRVHVLGCDPCSGMKCTAWVTMLRNHTWFTGGLQIKDDISIILQ